MVNYCESDLNSLFGALADPTRRAILAQLTAGITSVSELAQPNDMSLPAITKHLNVLERAGLIERQKQGRVSYCRLQANALKAVSKWISFYEQFWGQRLEALDIFLMKHKGDKS